jgi:hypothetical protein
VAQVETERAWEAELPLQEGVVEGFYCRQGALIQLRENRAVEAAKDLAYDVGEMNHSYEVVSDPGMAF